MNRLLNVIIIIDFGYDSHQIHDRFFKNLYDYITISLLYIIVEMEWISKIMIVITLHCIKVVG